MMRRTPKQGKRPINFLQCYFLDSHSGGAWRLKRPGGQHWSDLPVPDVCARNWQGLALQPHQFPVVSTKGLSPWDCLKSQIKFTANFRALATWCCYLFRQRAESSKKAQDLKERSSIFYMLDELWFWMDFFTLQLFINSSKINVQASKSSLAISLGSRQV